MRVLVTRPEPAASETARILHAAGHEVLVDPLLAIRYTGDAPGLAGVTALLATSRNGIEGFAVASGRRDLPVYAVGDATAQAAAALGFAQIVSARGDAAALAALVRERHAPDDGVLLHASGEEVAEDLSALLSPYGFTVCRAILYRAIASEALGAAASSALAASAVDAVLFFSPRTAAIFVRVVRAAGLAGHLAASAALCLSASVAAALGDTQWRSVAVAERPDQEALLALLAQDDRAESSNGG
jgi:uroporphyrinogen-III synthase